MELQGVDLIVTGADGNLGQVICHSLSPKVRSVIGLDRSETGNPELLSLSNFRYYSCDVTDAAACEVTAELIFASGKLLPVLVNCAGIIHSEPLINLLAKPDKKHSLPNWHTVINVNLNGVFNMSRAVAEKMVTQRNGGLIINISSIAAQGNVGQSAYTASKAAVEALAKTWSKELGMFKIRSCALAPGFIHTASTTTHVNEHMLEKWKKSVPTGRLGDASEVVSALEFMISNDYFNGKVLSLDGGLTI